MKQHYLIRSGSLSGFDALVSELEGDSEDLLSRCGLSRDDFSNPDNLIAFAGMINLLELAAEQLDCKDFGLRLAAKQGVEVLGPVGMLMQSSLTVREALANAQRYMAVHSHGEYWMVREINQTALIERYQVFQDISHAKQYKELSFGVCLRLIKALIGSQTKVQRLEFAHAPISDHGVYRKYFECQVVFNQENDRLILDSAYLSQDVQLISQEDKHLIEVYLKSLIDQFGDDIERKVKTLILQTMGIRESNIEDIALLLNMNKRTLQRRLKDRGLTFKQLLKEVRISTACWHLESSNIDITLLSEVLGFADVSAFSKSFRHSMSSSPLQWRKASNEKAK
ncbi:MAG: AraC family transcriptional regulator [Shewanella sp.]|nr:AraC family transcriptional regulator [Shewanella sp.]